MKNEFTLGLNFSGRSVEADFFWGPGYHVFGEGIEPSLAVKEANEKIERICFELGAVRPKGEWVWQGVNRNSGNPSFVLKVPEEGEVFVTENMHHTK